jgi:hypothetical protein
VLVPLLVPFTAILTPGNGAPLASVTLPVTVFSWANVGINTIAHKKKHKCNVLFMIVLKVWFY